jgi:hypothetical protein
LIIGAQISEELVEGLVIDVDGAAEWIRFFEWNAW